MEEGDDEEFCVPPVSQLYVVNCLLGEGASIKEFP